MSDETLGFLVIIGGGGLVLFVLGAVVAGLLSLFLAFRGEVHRAPYFAYTGLFQFVFVIVQFAWTVIPRPLLNTYVWIIITLCLSASFVIGFFYTLTSAARSRSISGHGWFAFLAFIPIANIWLWVREARNPDAPNTISVPSVFKDGSGVLLGFTFLISTAVLSAYLPLNDQEPEETTTISSEIDKFVRSRGLDGTLRFIEDSAKKNLPHKISENSYLEKVEAAGTELRRVIVSKSSGHTMTDEFRQRVIKTLCEHDMFGLLVKHGATIREVYIEESGVPIGNVTVTKATCEQ